jgi:hypothetical protein
VRPSPPEGGGPVELKCLPDWSADHARRGRPGSPAVQAPRIRLIASMIGFASPVLAAVRGTASVNVLRCRPRSWPTSRRCHTFFAENRIGTRCSRSLSCTLHARASPATARCRACRSPALAWWTSTSGRPGAVGLARAVHRAQSCGSTQRGNIGLWGRWQSPHGSILARGSLERPGARICAGR